MLTLGSLFDGSGGFPLGGVIAGMRPVWNSEIEPFPIRVTEKRFPDVIHYGDVSKMNGAEIPPVDVVTFGSPCQDLSIAGKQAGLKGARSGLFFQAIRIIKEMRDKTNGKYPRYAVWENVKGALSSAGGADFRQVLEELCRIKSSGYSVPQPEKWNRAGAIMGDGFSLAWRVIDAQYWGVPQRRKRIYLVCDFAGYNAPRVLFESESVPGDPETLRGKEQRPAGTAEKRIDKTICLNDQGGASISIETGRAPTLRAEVHQHLPIVFGISAKDSNAMKSSNPHSGVYKADTVRTLDTSGGSPACNQGGMMVVFENHSNDSRYSGPKDKCPCLNSQMGTGGNNAPLVCYSISKEGHMTKACKNKTATLAATDYKDPVCVNTSDCRVRRLTPLECGRLQGFPDYWCDGLTDDNPTPEKIEKWQKIFNEYCDINGKKRRSENQIRKWLKTPPGDAAMYKMWGNGVALPCVVFVMCGIVWADSEIE